MQGRARHVGRCCLVWHWRVRLPVVVSSCSYASSFDQRVVMVVFDGAASVLSVVGWGVDGVRRSILGCQRPSGPRQFRVSPCSHGGVAVGAALVSGESVSLPGDGDDEGGDQEVSAAQGSQPWPTPLRSRPPAIPPRRCRWFQQVTTSDCGTSPAFPAVSAGAVWSRVAAPSNASPAPRRRTLVTGRWRRIPVRLQRRRTGRSSRSSADAGGGRRGHR